MHAGIIIGGNGDGRVGRGARFGRDGRVGTRLTDRHGNVVESGCGLGGLEKNDDRRAGGHPFRHERLPGSVGEFAARELILPAVQNGRLQNCLAIEDVRDVKRQHDVGRFFQGADLLAQAAQLGWIAGRRRRAILAVDGIGVARTSPTLREPGVPAIAALRQSGEVAKVAVDNFQAPLNGRCKPQQGDHG